jgi:hypothetical protein
VDPKDADDRGDRMAKRLLILAMAVTALAGCTGGTGEGEGGPTTLQTTASEPDADLVAWLDGFCAAYTAVSPEPFDGTVPDETTEEDRAPLLQFIDGTLSDIETWEAEAAAVPDAPDHNAQVMLEQYRTELEELRVKFEEHAEHAALYPAGEALTSVYFLAVWDLAGFSPLSIDTEGTGFLSYVDSFPELQEAAALAPACPGSEASATATD